MEAFWLQGLLLVCLFCLVLLFSTGRSLFWGQWSEIRGSFFFFSRDVRYLAGTGNYRYSTRRVGDPGERGNSCFRNQWKPCSSELSNSQTHPRHILVWRHTPARCTTQQYESPTNSMFFGLLLGVKLIFFAVASLLNGTFSSPDVEVIAGR